MPFAITALLPAIAIAIMVEVERACWLKLPSKTSMQLILEPFNAAVVNCVLETSVLANGTVAVIALYRNCLLGNIDHLLWCTEADYLRYLRVGFGVAVGHTHAPAYRHIKAL
ncbi:hypothetical protein D3C78_846820 [compost metagenome]